MHNDVVSDVSYAGLRMRGDVLGLERRRWDDEEKLGIVLSVGADGATVTQVAQRHDVTRQQIYAWRPELKKKGLLFPTADTLFLPISTPEPMEPALPEAALASPTAPDPQIELVLANGRCLRFAPDLEPAVLVRLIRVVEAA
ncbi:IS66-like element accessory protein TnpA [Paracoccus versutus]|uniref:IS66-like element accessory protein TnpA n=1 Tax=Paracoccus versutus TaxID=34007 RepID=UPI001C690996|nr:transposase [Paracoccus versutus]